MSEYDSVITSSLKLKGVSESSGKIKKKSKKKKKSKDLEPSYSSSKDPRDVCDDGETETPSAEEGSSTSSYYKGKTKTELQFLKRKEKLDTERIKKKASVSHKERVEKFNEYLNNLSEHYEPAKVSWTK
uniref:FAM32A n=1 Tax=Caligus clemensi TaxID=344056 RepID=C1C1U4_CALCM|nr:FAM32A [Caligus clemensi]